jgi:hypothetical protein
VHSGSGGEALLLLPAGSSAAAPGLRERPPRALPGVLALALLLACWYSLSWMTVAPPLKLLLLRALALEDWLMEGWKVHSLSCRSFSSAALRCVSKRLSAAHLYTLSWN